MFSRYSVLTLTRAQAYYLLSFLVILSSIACNPPKDDQVIDMMSSDTGVIDMELMEMDSEVDAEVVDPCQNPNDCDKAECTTARVCAPCEDGGNCIFSGKLRIYGRAISIQSQSISDLNIRAICGTDEVIAYPGEGGVYELEFQVNQCERLVLVAERQQSTEGYVPIVKKFNMPPPVNTLKVDFKLIPGKEIRCDGAICEAPGVYESYDYGSFYTGYAYNSDELNEVSNFGSIFESADGQLLWLHRFIYRDLRDEQSRTISRLEYNQNTLVLYGLSRLSYETRAWVADLFDGYLATDYHTEENSRVDWEMYASYLTDPQIDSDNDGQYETIDMMAYQLDFSRGQWSILNLDQQQLVAHIFAEVEPGFDIPQETNIGINSPGDYYVKVPNVYLRGVQTTGNYGPAVDDGVDDNGRLNQRGLYGTDYTGIPYYGSGIFAVGQPVPKSCWVVNVVDACGAPVFGSEINVIGVNHGYHYNEISDQEGKACIEVGRSESNGADFDGDGLSNERFDVEITATSPLGRQRLLPSSDRIESTPTVEADCRMPSACQEITFTFQNCQ